jgi:hypothetical protein
MWRLWSRNPQPKARDLERHGVDFVDSEDDTPDNRAIVAVVEERRERREGRDRDLDEVVAELGFEPADFLHH